MKHFRKLPRESKHLEEYGKIVLTDDDSTNTGIEYTILEHELNDLLEEKLKSICDGDFKFRKYYIKRWGYEIIEIGGMPYYYESAHPPQTQIYKKLKFI